MIGRAPSRRFFRKQTRHQMNLIAQRPKILSAVPFYPGIEVSWLIRVKALYSEPFRLNIPRESEAPGAPYPKIPIGALFFQPGFFSQQMALPWQADFYDCQKENHQDPGDTDKNKDYWFMWWTAQRPDDTYPSGGLEPQRRWVTLSRLHDGQPTGRSCRP